MSDSIAEEISPSYIRERRLDLTLDPAIKTVRAYQSVLVNVSYAKTFPAGVMLPLLLEIQGSSPESYQRREFTRVAPSSIIFTPREGGRHKVILREVAHNRWFGSLSLDVAGEMLRPPRPT